MSGHREPAGERLLRIGTFSRQAKLSPHQLRHYHEVGLLLPASVDPESGYRYYSAAQTATADVIAILRSVDMPLVEIRELLGDPSRERVQATLDRHLARLERRLAVARSKLEALRDLMKEGRLMPVNAGSRPIEVAVEGVRLHMPSGQHVLMLRERAGDRFLPIWVGPMEANAVATHLHGTAPARPLTHDLLATLIERSATEVDRVTITRWEAEVYYASIQTRVGGAVHEIDARPSDAVNVALRAGAPIFVDADVLDQRSVVRSRDDEVPSPPTVLVMAVDAETAQQIGFVTLQELPSPGDEIQVPRPVACRVVSVEAPAGEMLPRVVVERPAG